MTDTAQQLKLATQMARSGDKERAIMLFTRILEADPRCVPAWLWLSEFADSLEEQTVLLEEALKYIPVGPDGTKDLQGQLNEMHGFIPLHAPQADRAQAIPAGTAAEDPAAEALFEKRLNEEAIYQQAERMSITGRRPEALSMLQNLTAAGSRMELVWQLAGELNPDLAEKIRALEAVLAINPANAAAASRLAAFRAAPHQPLAAGQRLEAWGEWDQALDLYQALSASAPTEAARAEARRRLARLQKQQAAAAKRSPRRSLLSLASALFARMS